MPANLNEMIVKLANFVASVFEALGMDDAVTAINDFIAKIPVTL